MGVYGVVFLVIYILSLIGMYYYVKKKYSTVNLTEVNGLLSEILETNFKNNSLSNAAQSILIVLKRFYNIDGITILLYHEKSGNLEVISSNIGNKFLKSVEDRCNELLQTGNMLTPKTFIADGDHLSYPTAYERGIKFSNFTPLAYKGRLIGAILLESKEVNHFMNDKSRMKLYDKVFNSTALVLQNVIYTENLISMTSTDQLTGVYNRRYIDMTLAEQLNIHRNLGMSMSVAIFDIDHFKKFNDIYGHPFGDIVLQQTAQFMKRNMGENEWVAIYGGEEFILFFGRSKPNEVYKKVEYLRESLSKIDFTDGTTHASVTASFGIATYPKFDESASGLIIKADQALYLSKERGRNRVTVAD